jgi:hypothetical protein
MYVKWCFIVLRVQVSNLIYVPFPNRDSPNLFIFSGANSQPEGRYWPKLKARAYAKENRARCNCLISN